MKNKLNKTWFIDLDGTIVKHNGYLSDSETVLEKSKHFLDSIDKDDVIIITTGRKEEFKESTEKFLKDNDIRYNHIIFNLPLGERVLINDLKPSGMTTAYSFNITRDSGIDIDLLNLNKGDI